MKTANELELRGERRPRSILDGSLLVPILEAEARRAQQAAENSAALDALRPGFFRRILINLGLVRNKHKGLALGNTECVLKYTCDPAADFKKLRYSENNPFSL